MNRIKVSSQIKSTTHQNYSLDCTPDFSIRQENQDYFIDGELNVGKEVQIDAWRAVDSFLAGLSIIEKGVFSRIVWNRHNLKSSIKFLTPPPNELPGTGLQVSDVNQINLINRDLYIEAYVNIYEKAVKDNNAFAILSTYTVSNWFFNDDLIREAGINYFCVVEAIASIKLPNLWEKSVYNLKDIHKAMVLLGIEKKELDIIDEAHNARGELAHGHPKHLLLSQHVLKSQPVSSGILKKPALICKSAADLVLKKYFNIPDRLSRLN